jgi:RNA polymerase sigma factor (sigma-70 family)
MIGLINAVNKFNFDKKVLFTTYASLWIKQAMGRACEQQGSTNRFGHRLPSHIINALTRIARSRDELERRLGRDATAAELAAACEISEDAAVQALRVQSLQRPLSIDRVADDDASADGTLAARIADPHADPALEVEQLVEAEVLREMLRRLPDDERELLTHRYGLDGTDPVTERELTERWDTDRSKLQVSHRNALERLRSDAALAQAVPSALPRKLHEGVARSMMSQSCGHLRLGTSPEQLELAVVSRMSDRAFTGRVAGGWWLVSRPEHSQQWQVKLLDGQDGEMLSPGQAAQRMCGEQLLEASEWMARVPLQRADECMACASAA